ncbi:MAG: DUF4123 domain-containing protein [Gammaproteobacteria bacterium]|nr:DUF4123 domain-containing protein [Gammaproteobacteria bacterium]
MPTLPELPALNWHQQHWLLLDAIALPAAVDEVVELRGIAHCINLFEGGRLHDLADVAPWLVALDGPDDPLLSLCLPWLWQEGAALLCDDGDTCDLLNHLHWLLTVEHPVGEPLLLRIGEPSVLHALLSDAAQQRQHHLFGPIVQMISVDAALGQWQRGARPGPMAEADRNRPYRLQPEQLRLLDEVNFRRVVLGLSQHLASYFPGWMAGQSMAARYQRLQQLANRAYELGFTSEQEITLYANILAQLGDNALDRHPEIRSRLFAPNQPAAQRAMAAAELAQQIAHQHQARMPQ